MYHGRLGAHLQHNVSLCLNCFPPPHMALSKAGYLCIPAVLPILKEVANSVVPDDNNQDHEIHGESTLVILGVVANIFQKIIELLALCLRKEPEEGQLLCQSAIPSVTDFLQVAQTWEAALLSGVYSTVFAAIIVEKRHLLQKLTLPEEVLIPQSVDEMPPLSNLLLSVILKSPFITRSFLAEVSSSLDSDALSSLTELAAVLHVLAVIKQSMFSYLELSCQHLQCLFVENQSDVLFISGAFQRGHKERCGFCPAAS
ncbi:hypothetical protein XENOCAPTIV_008325 [Xenoophorus captivus]|uniref:Uncharacterized protein n=1 Tax=Xenoophorus captivus TaxID=1517983 RepID=A0ABV0SCC5_9TELE